ncbi:MAG: SLC13 family permease [Bacillota bacterium]|jgi:anion transporter
MHTIPATNPVVASKPTKQRLQLDKLKLTMAVVGIAMGLFIALQPPWADLSPQAMYTLGLLAAAICFWIGRVFDDYVVALIMGVGWVALKIVPFETAFATFHSKTWWLMLGAMGLGLGVAKSGLLRRSTLLMLKTMPPTYLGQSLALLITGLIAAPAIPSIVAKVSIAAKFVPELVRGMGLPMKSKASAGLFMAMYLGFVATAPIFLTGSSTNLLMLDMLPASEQAAMSWMGWLKAALVPGVLTLLGAFLLIMLFMAPKQKVAADLTAVKRQLQELGPFSRKEKITLVVLVVAIALWVTEAMHGIHAVIVALAGLSALLATGVVDKKSLQSELGWATLIFLGVILNLGVIIPELGIDGFLGQQVSLLLSPLSGNSLLFIAALMAITIGLRFLVVSVNALLTICILVLAAVAGRAGLNVWVLGFAVQYIGHLVFFLPYQSATYIVAVGSSGQDVITPGDTARASLIFITAIAVAICLSVPLWHLFGIVR